MAATWTVTDGNNTNMTAYIAYRAAQDGATVTLDQAIAELLLMAGIPSSGGHRESPGIKAHGNFFHIL